MEHKNSQDVDLFGEPWRPLKDQRGRKRHKWAAENAEKVALFSAAGLTHEQIADRVGLDPKTLRKYYSRELNYGPELAMSVIDLVMWEKAKAGVVGAARYIRETIQGGKVKKLAAPKERKVEPVGKKAAKVQQAGAVDGLYAVPPPPRSVQ